MVCKNELKMQFIAFIKAEDADLCGVITTYFIETTYNTTKSTFMHVEAIYIVYNNIIVIYFDKSVLLNDLVGLTAVIIPMSKHKL